MVASKDCREITKILQGIETALASPYQTRAEKVCTTLNGGFERLLPKEDNNNSIFV